MKARKSGFWGWTPERKECFNETGPLKARKFHSAAVATDSLVCFNETGPLKARKFGIVRDDDAKGV